jgi:hypothetical protein
MVRKFLLKVALGVQLQHVAHVRNRHLWHLGRAQHRFGDTDRNHDLLGLASKRGGHGLQVFSELGRVQEILPGHRFGDTVAGKAEATGAPLEKDGLRAASPQIDGNDLVPPFIASIQKCPTHSVVWSHKPSSSQSTGINGGQG